MPFAGGPPSKSILNLYEDREGNLWIGSQIGMERLSRSAMSLLPLPGSPDADFGSVFVDRDGSIWACSTSLYRERDGVMRKEELRGLHGVTIRNLLRAADGSLWVGTEGSGVFRLACICDRALYDCPGPLERLRPCHAAGPRRQYVGGYGRRAESHRRGTRYDTFICLRR